MKNKKTFKLPYVGIKGDAYPIIYTDSGDYCTILRLPNIIIQNSYDEGKYYAFHNFFNTIINVLGEGFTIQKQDIIQRENYTPKHSNDLLSNEYFKSFNQRSYIKIDTYLIVTQNVQRSRLFVFDDKLFKSFDKKINQLFDLAKSNDIQLNPLTQFESEHYIKKVVALNFSDKKFYIDNIKATEERLFFGDYAVQSISIIDIDDVTVPGEVKPFTSTKVLGKDMPTDLMGFIYNIPHYETILFNQVIEIPNQKKILTGLENKKNRHASMPDPSNDMCVEDIDNLFKNIAKDSQYLVHAHFNILIKAKKDKIDTSINYIESSLFSLFIFPSKNSYNQLELYRSCFPGNTSTLQSYDKLLTTSDAAICFLLKDTIIQDEKSSFKIYFSDRQGVPVAVDTNELPMQQGRIDNRNKFILGPSGSGKSFLMNHIIRQYTKYNMDVVIVDTGHSYQNLCKYVGGVYITYSEDKPITMNCFKISSDEFNEEKRAFFKSLIAVLWKGANGKLNQIEDTVLSRVIGNYYQTYFGAEHPNYELSFNSFYEFSVKAINVITKKDEIPFDIQTYEFVLKKFYKGGEYELTLNNDSEKSLFDANFIVFEIDAIKENPILFPITTLIIMDVFLQKMRLKKNRKALIIEEAWKAIASPVMANYILYLYKTVRKFWGEAILVTQELEDILGSEIIKNSVLANSDSIYLLDQSKFKDNYAEVSQFLGLNTIEQNKIFSINNLENKKGRRKFKEFYLKRGLEGEVYGVEVSDHEYMTYTTEKAEKEALQIYLDRSINYHAGLNAFINDLKKSKLSTPDFCTQILNSKSYKHEEEYSSIAS